MSETSRGILLGLVYILEFLEFLAGPWGLTTGLLVGLYGSGMLVFLDNSSTAIATMGLSLIVSFRLLVSQQD